MTLRRALDTLYDAAGYLAALFLIGTLAMVVVSIAGRWMNFHLPGTDAYAGYCMAAAGFLALAHTLKRGEHIRVTLLIERTGARRRRLLEIWALSAGVLLALLFAWFSTRLAWQSFDFNDVSTASDATPLWIPQLSMAVGTVVLAIALVDELVREIRGERRPAASAASTFNE